MSDSFLIVPLGVAAGLSLWAVIHPRSYYDAFGGIMDPAGFWKRVGFSSADMVIITRCLGAIMLIIAVCMSVAVYKGL